MIYRNFQNEQLSLLVMGAMRLPTTAEGTIDEPAVREMVAYAFRKGINYFDTAWGYHNGESEKVMGRVLAAYPRDSFFLASKFPGYDLSNMTKVEEIFETQLRKCGGDYFDFYLFHNVCELNIDHYLDESYGIFEYLMKQKEHGRIRHLGFSAHGNVETIRRFLEKYGHAMEFGQLQLNWLDWDFQNSREKYELFREYQIPVWVMEPLRGGKLANLTEGEAASVRALRPGETTAEIAFRFLERLPAVTVILSGMSNFTQLEENIAIFEQEKPMTEAETAGLLAIAKGMTEKIALPCTACRYCTEYCPKGIDIPRMLELYNEHIFTGGGFLAPMALQTVEQDKLPSACIGCRNCEAVCPQGIKISEALSDFCEKLG